MEESSAAFHYSAGMSSMIYILTVLVCITLSFLALQQIRLDLFLKNPRSGYAKLLLIFVSIALGYQVAEFLIAYAEWTGMLKGLFTGA